MTLMITDQQIEEQKSFERRQIQGGLDKIRKQTKDLEEKAYASATEYGRASIDSLLPKLAKAIQAKVEKNMLTATGYQKSLYTNYITKLDSESAAAITCKRAFDKIFSTKKDDNTVTKVCEAIAHAIEAECQMRHYETVAPGLLHILKENYWHQSKGTEQKLVSIRTVINRYDIPKWEPWTGQYAKIGGWFLDVMCKVSGWFEKYTVYRKKKNTYIIPTETFLKDKQHIVTIAELFSPLTWPMLIPPRNWTNIESGGYYLNALTKCHELVRRGPPLSIQGKTPLSFLNKIQKVEYKLNPFVVSVAEALDEAGIAVGKFRPIMEYHLPPKPLNIAEDKEVKKSYRRKAAEIWDKRSQETRRSCRTRMTMNAVAEFKDVDKFYIPWSFDYRGRTYPIPSFLTPQDSDFGKSLIRFAEESLMTPKAERWLSFHIATTYGKDGLDKECLTVRHEWPKKDENFTLIKRVAEDPIGNRPDWEVAEEPWQFLAACDEYYHCVIKKDRLTTGLPVAIDATCSGLQILAGLARDKSTATLVNVIPTKHDIPQDAYKVVAMKSRGSIPDTVKPYWDRKSVKRSVMTIPYNAKPHSNRSYIKTALKEKGFEISQEDLTQTVKAVRDTMNTVVPGPMKVMKWIEDEVIKAIKRGDTELKWETPSGFRVIQRLMKPDCKYIHLQLLGKCKVWAAVGHTDQVDLMHHRNATAPNLIHSLDASLLHIAALRFDNPIALIHDSVLCRATDMSVLDLIVRETYMHLFAEHDYLKTFAQQIGAETEPPIIGDLEPSNVLKSTYFFC